LIKNKRIEYQNDSLEKCVLLLHTDNPNVLVLKHTKIGVEPQCKIIIFHIILAKAAIKFKIIGTHTPIKTKVNIRIIDFDTKIVKEKIIINLKFKALA
jgi:hypothetical protein